MALAYNIKEIFESENKEYNVSVKNNEQDND